jgi:hypothetical protein
MLRIGKPALRRFVRIGNSLTHQYSFSESVVTIFNETVPGFLSRNQTRSKVADVCGLETLSGLETA